jgi:hypothetical protein
MLSCGGPPGRERHDGRMLGDGIRFTVRAGDDSSPWQPGTQARCRNHAPQRLTLRAGPSAALTTMPTHLFVINARPTLAADPNGKLGGAIVHVWVIENGPMLAQESALRQITEYDWVVEDIAYHFELTALQIAQLGEKERRSYEKAKTYGVSTEFIAWAKDESSFEELFRGPRAPKIFPVSDRRWREQQAHSSRFQAAVRRRFAEKHCLHPAAAAGICGGGIVRAHTVQRSSLQRIARVGHVYRLSADLRVLDQSGGIPSAELVGVNRASTFNGLCARHDDQTFAPIEKRPFHGDAEQCFLLAYRAVLRETYLKRLASRPLPEFVEQIERAPESAQSALRQVYDAHMTGTNMGLASIQQHKAQFDWVFRERSFRDIRFVVFWFRAVPSVMVNAAWFPTSDFDGNELRNLDSLGQVGSRPDMLTLSVVGADTGGAAVLAWHRSCDATCNPFVASLVRHRSELTTSIVQLIFQISENSYLNPEWWDTLPAEAQKTLLNRSAKAWSPFEPFAADDLLCDALELGSWEPDSVAACVTAAAGLLETVQPIDPGCR